MKTITKFASLTLVICFTAFAQKTYAQTTVYPSNNFMQGPHDEVRSNTQVEEILGGNASSRTYLNGFGINTYFTPSEMPSYLLDVYCDPNNNTLSDINISCPNCTPANSVGYRIGGQMVLWHSGAVSDIYVGVGAGYSGALNSTALGYYALHNNTAASNTAVGFYALYANTGGGGGNTAVGASALSSNTIAQFNTAIGWGALSSNNGAVANLNEAAGAYSLQYNTIGSDNSANGAYALNSNTTGTSNTATGAYALNANTTVSGLTAIGTYALYSNSTGTGNTADGFSALIRNTGGSNNTANGYNSLYFNTNGFSNTATGYNSLYFNTIGTLNTAIGVNALYSNTVLSGNVAIGDSALYSQNYNAAVVNTGNVAVGNSALYSNQAMTMAATPTFNTAIGQWAMKYNTTGFYNTANGGAALYANTSGSNITADGVQALYSNTSGSNNTATGFQALYSNVSGGGNVATGFQALYFNNNGYYNTAIGSSAGYSNTGNENTFLGNMAGYGCISNAMNNDVFVGYNSGPSMPQSNTVYLGNTSTVSLETYASISLTSWSDRRVKDSVKENVPGLAFIAKLKPITFHYNVRKENELMGINDTAKQPGKYDVEKITQSGFIAQAVDSAAHACGYDFCGITRPKNSHQAYTLGYTTFVVPLVKAVQELSAKNDSLHSTVDSLRSVLKSIQNCLTQLCNNTGNGHAPTLHNSASGGNSNNDSLSSNSTTVQDVTLSGISDAPLLFQNIPNPFSTGTKINYYLPAGTMGATVIFYDTYGNQIKTVQLSQTGNGTLNITPDNLSNGIYAYSLIVNGNVIDTKKMVLQK